MNLISPEVSPPENGCRHYLPALVLADFEPPKTMDHPKYPAALEALNELFRDTSVSRAETLETIENLIAEAEMLKDDLCASLKGEES